MNIRRAEEKDIPRIIELLKQVLQIHADIRPAVASVWAMPFVSYRNSLFLTIQYRLSRCMSTICA